MVVVPNGKGFRLITGCLTALSGSIPAPPTMFFKYSKEYLNDLVKLNFSF